MIGVNLDNIDALINKNNSYIRSLSSDSNRFLSIINDLKECYTGSGLDYLFGPPINQALNLNSILKLINNYSDILYSVKTSYQRQDFNLKTQVNHLNSNL